MNDRLKQQTRAHNPYVLGRALNKLSALVHNSPQNPGIYIFKNKKDGFLYIGKAVNLKNRTKQYFRKETRSPFLQNLTDEAENIEYIITESEIEALILESQLIKKHQPKFNIMLRDGKEYFYVGFTNDEFPKIFISHNPVAIKREVTRLGVPHRAQTAVGHYGGEEGQDPEAHRYIGPFTDGTALKTTLKLLRRIFPYCTCKQKHNNFCLNYHIGKCPGFCCLKQQNPDLKIRNENLKNYNKNIKAIRDILSGKRDPLIKDMKKEMNRLGKNQEFEKAIELRNKIEKLEKIFANAKIILDAKYLISDTETGIGNLTVLKKITEIFKLLKPPRRIEGYDISNIQGKNATGSMVIFTDGKPGKNEYRKFKIRIKETPDDIAMLKEILARRLKHHEWPYPDLIFIDGGIAQLNAADGVISNFQFPMTKQIRNSKFKIPIISLAKGRNEIFSTTLKKPVAMEKLPETVKNLIKHIDSEAHKFAIGYHRKLRRKTAFQ